MSTRSTRSKSSTASPDVEAQRAARFKSTVSRLAAEDASLSGLRLPLYHRADVTELCKVASSHRLSIWRAILHLDSTFYENNLVVQLSLFLLVVCGSLEDHLPQISGPTPPV